MAQHNEELLAFASSGIALFTAGCCFVLRTILQDVKTRAENGERLASRYCVLPLYERLLVNVGVIYLIDASVLCAGYVIAMSIIPVHWTVQNTNMCGIICASFVPFRSFYSIWSTRAARKVSLCLLVWLIIGTSLISFPRSEHMSQDLLVWCRVSTCIPSFIGGVVGIYQSLQNTHSRPNCLYSAMLLLAYTLAITLCELVMWKTQSPHTAVPSIFVHAVCTTAVPVALLCDARGDTASWKRFGKISPTAIYDCGSPALASSDLEQGCCGKLNSLFGLADKRNGKYGAAPSLLSHVMYNTNRYVLDFAEVVARQRHQIDTCDGIFRSQRVAVTVLTGKRAQEAASAQGVNALKTEMLLYHSLRDESVQQMIGYCFSPPAVLIVSELCDNGSLQVSLQRDRVIWDDSQRRLSACADLCRAVAHAHSKGILHGDICTRHIMVTSSWSLKLTGFEVPSRVRRESATAVASDLSRKLHVDTPSPPRRKRVSRASLERDVEALGCTVVEIWSSGRTTITDSNSHSDSGEGMSKDMLVQWLDSHTDDIGHTRSSVEGGERNHNLLNDLPNCLRLLLKVCFGDSSNKCGGVHTLLGGLLTDIKRAAIAAGENSPLYSAPTRTYSPIALRTLHSLRRAPENRRRLERLQHTAVALDDREEAGEDTTPKSSWGRRVSPCNNPVTLRESASDGGPNEKNPLYIDSLADHYLPANAVCCNGGGACEGDERSVVLCSTNPLFSK